MTANTAPRRLFIHAGTHKTGSKSIQFLLGENARQIFELGTRVVFDHPSHGQARTNCSSIANAFIRQELATSQRIQARFLTDYGSQETIGWLLRQFNDPGRRDFIISCESFCYMRTPDERELLMQSLSPFSFEIVPIVYFRSDASWRRSWTTHLTNQVRKVNQADKQYLVEDWYFDRDAIAAFWQAASPQAVFVDYDEEMQKVGSIVPSFLEIVGLPQSLNAKGYFVHRTQYPAAAPPK